jgi:Staphylococcal nuclease homologue
VCVAAAGEGVRPTNATAPGGQLGRDQAAGADGRPIDRLPGEGRDRYGRIVAICRVSGGDLGAILVRKGFAWAFTRFSVDCVDRQEEARAANRGHPLELRGSAIADQEPVTFEVSRAL